MLDVLIVWLIWVRRVPRPRRRSPAAGGASGARRRLVTGRRASRERPSACPLRGRHAGVAAGRVRRVVRARAGHPVAGRSCSCAASLAGAFADLVRSVEAHGATLSFVTTLRPGEARAGGVLSVDVNMLLYAFGLPLFVALTLAARQAAMWRALADRLPRDAAVHCLGRARRLSQERRHHRVAAGRIAGRVLGPRQRDIIVFAYQFGSLILPAVVPAVAWVLTHRVFLERLRMPADRG